MGDAFEKYRNPDGKTYNGVALFADISGLSSIEVTWAFNRLRHLIHVEGKSTDEARNIVKQEASSKPWITAE